MITSLRSSGPIPWSVWLYLRLGPRACRSSTEFSLPVPSYPLWPPTPLCTLDRIINLQFSAALHMLASNGVPLGDGVSGSSTTKRVAAVAARLDVQHPQRVPLGRPARCLVFRGAFALPVN